MTVIASATDDRVGVVTSDKGQKGDTGTAGLDGAGFDTVRESLIDSPLCRLFTPNKLVDTLAGSLTWTRASNATYVDRYGVIKTAATDEPREESDGWLIEGVSTNLFTYSEQFDNSDWIKSRSSISTNSLQSPDGTTTAEFISETVDSGNHGAFQFFSFTSGSTYTASFFVKANTRTQCGIFFGSTGDTTTAFFDLSNGTILVNSGSAKIESLGDDWYRVSSSNTPTLTGTGSAVLVLVKDGTDDYAGDGTSGLYVWGAQLEELPFATSYIPTTTASVTRAGDLVSSQGYNNLPETANGFSSAFNVNLLGRFGANQYQNAVSSNAFSWLPDNGFISAAAANAEIMGTINVLVSVGVALSQQVVITSQDSVQSSYIDGAQKATASVTSQSTSISDIKYGATLSGYLNFFGHLSDFRIYDFALNADEVKFLSGVK